MKYTPRGVYTAIVTPMTAEDEFDEAAFRKLVDFQIDAGTQERFVYSHRGVSKDLIVWENRAVLHRATIFQSTNERRQDRV